MAAEAGELEAIFRLSDQITPRMPALVSAVEKADQAVGKMADSVDGLSVTLGPAAAQMEKLHEEALKMNQDFDPAPIEEWSKAQQRAGMRMEALHEEALKMDGALGSTDDKAQRFSQTLGSVSSTATASAAALGLPIGRLGALNSVADVAGLGLGKLTKSAVGFNVASVGVAGAGLAVGTMIGGLIRDLPGAADAYDALAESALGYFGLLAKNTGPATTNLAAMDAIQKQVQQNVINMMRSQGKTTDEIISQLTGKYVPALDKVVDGLKKGDEAQAKAAAAASKTGEEQKRAAERAAEAYAQAAEKARVERDKFYDEMSTRSTTVTRQMEDDIAAAATKIMAARTKQFEEELQTAESIDQQEAKRQAEADERLDEETQAFIEAQEEKKEALEETFEAVAGVLGALDDLFAEFGVSADGNLRLVTQGFIEMADAGADFAAAFAKGDVLGMSEAGIRGLIGVIHVFKGLFNDVEWERVNDMRDEFVAAAGGIDKLNQRAVAAGLSLDRLLDAKKVKDYEEAVEMLNLQLEFVEGRGGLRELKAAAEQAGISLQAMFDAKSAEALKLAIDDIGKGLDTWNEAMRLTQEAMDKYGITVDQMGAKFAQQKLDEQAMQLFQDYSLLTAAGADHNLVLEKMAPSINEYVQTALRAGAAIPESMRPIIDAMIANGQLLDENGNAYASAEEAGITYAMSTSEAMKLLIEKITELVNALLGIPTNINTDVNTNFTTSGTPPGDPGEHGGEHHAAHGFHGMVYRPTRFLVGEAGPERVDVSPAGGGGGVGGGGGMQITVNVNGAVWGSPELPDQIAKAIVHEVRNNQHGLMTEISRQLPG